MKTTARRVPAVPIALAAALLTAFLVLIAPLSASAHDSLIASTPEADATVDVLPSELTLTFSAELIGGEGATEVVVTDPSGASATAGAAVTEGATVTQPLAATSAAGAYHVIWKVVSSDGHPTSGEFDFTVATATGGAPSASPTPQPTAAEQTAAPAPETTSTPAAADDDDSAASAWIWILAIAGILVIAVGTVVAFAMKGRGAASAAPDGTAEGDSDAATGR